MSSTSNPRRLRWRVVDIVVAAVLGVAIGFVFFGWNFAGNSLGGLLKTFYPPLKGLVGGVWLLGGILGGLVIRKPGAAIFVEMVAALVSTLLGSQWGLTVLISGFLQGFGAELVFLLFFYRVWKLPVAMLAGVVAAGFEWVFELIAWYAGWVWPHKLVLGGTLMVSGAVLAGLLGWLIVRGLARTGALDRFESGREVRQLV
ncbi:MAG: ECF transporter S component [Propionibacteriaceae bacterium]|nr:ECF transporter S component [Propionibacteriaceae bacterium]